MTTRTLHNRWRGNSSPSWALVVPVTSRLVDKYLVAPWTRLARLTVLPSGPYLNLCRDPVLPTRPWLVA